MTSPSSEIPLDYAVNCYTCGQTIWQGNEPQGDGQVILTAYADSISGPACPSGISPCPHKAASLAVIAKLQAPTIKDLEAIAARLAKVEAKVKP